MAVPPAPPPRTSDKAVASLALGICGLIFLPLIGAILALVFGYAARRDIEGSQGALSGREFATAGIVLGWVGVGLVIAGLVVLIVLLLLVDDVFDDTTITVIDTVRALIPRG